MRVPRARQKFRATALTGTDMDMHIAPATVRQIASEFRSRKPYGFAAVDGLFDAATVRKVAREVEANLACYTQEENIYASYRKHRLSALDEMPEHARDFISALNAPPFLRVLSEITGIEDLQPDPELRGGGIHAIGRGGYLKLHTDFNWHRGLSMYRRLNLLVYLNEDWQDGWNGDIELWSADAHERIFSLSPRLGHALLFETNDISYHGHPDPLACPEGVFRKSIALYYYTPTRPAADLRFGKSEMTNFVERPAEKFEVDKVRRLRHRLQLQAKRFAHSLKRSHED
jgi:Rps23 Pro-64 3,4-dihydroxylase Tpa1-like proline 4-hydroxylase